MALKAEWSSGRLHLYDGADSAIGGRGLDFGKTSSSAYLHGAGNSTTQLVHSTAGNFLSYYLSGSAASGTYRGIYMRLYLTGGAGGEAVRAFTTVSNNAPADTVNGAHISLNFGASAGNLSGLGTAARCTLHIPNRALTGTTAGVQSEYYADGDTSSLTGASHSFLRAVLAGDATGLAAAEDTINLIEVAGGTNASGNLVSDAGNEPTWAAATYKIRCNMNGTTMYLVAVAA